MHLIDTHQHLWNLQQFPYAWCAGIPALNRSFLPGDYAAAAAGTGITRTVFVECDVDEPHALAEAQHIQSLASVSPAIAGIVASGRPENENFRTHLEALAQLPKVRGFRRVLHTQPDELSAQSRFIEHVRLLPEFGLSFDLCVLARQLPQAIALVDACPHVSFILDHAGVPDVKGRAFDPWREHLRALAERPNVACKLSGLVAYAGPDWTVADLQPWVEHVIACFGWDRVAWGGDWPVCTLGASLARWVEATRELTAGASESERARLFHRNAERLYRLEVASS
ncbi:amidohydrolase [Oleiharenicola lentus]|uniref:Amidohydrolase n=1 Tax=Oleiharenicola lentus TaxID=2508720 RepID=A0A4Q1C597_9BACT|nr:amidohydrolase [Oleiharenicola lentus]RXK53614.1 amidohydrolase [Oleiharenicola lentus]